MISQLTRLLAGQLNEFHVRHEFCFVFTKRKLKVNSLSHLLPWKLRRLSDEDSARTLGRLEVGIQPQDVANQFNVHRSTIVRPGQRYRATGSVKDLPRSCRPKVNRKIYRSDSCNATLR